MRKTLLISTALLLYNLLPAQNRDSLPPQTDSLPALVIHAPLIQRSVMRIPGAYQQVRVGASIPATGNSGLNALNALSGVYVQQGALNTNRITIRGVGSRSPFSSNRVKAYFAGIPLTGGDGETELDDISASLLNKVEVLKGGKSAFYGAGLGGVILFNPQCFAPEGWDTRLRTQFGDFGLQQYGLKTSRGSEKTETLLNANWYQSAGWRENSDYRRANALFLHRQQVGRHSLRVFVTGQKLYAEIPSSLSESDFQNNPTLAASNWKGVNGRELNEKLLAAVQGELKYGPDLEHQISLFYNYYRGKEYRPFNDLFDSNRRLGIRSLLSYDKKRLALQFVLEAFREWYRWETYQPGQDQLLNRFRENRSPLTLALQAGYSLSPKCYLEAGLSANFLQYRVEDLQSGSEPERFAYPAMWSPFLGLNYAFSEEWAVYGSVGHGFSYPSVQETLLPEGEKNPDLRPETGITGELGLRYAGARRHWSAELGLYHMQLSQMLVTERLPNGDGFGVNAGSARNAGLELTVRGKLGSGTRSCLPGLSFTNNTTLGRFRFHRFIEDGNDRSGNTLPGLPAFVNHFSLTARSDCGFSLQLEHHHYGKQFLNDANTESLGQYAVVNVRAKYAFSLSKIQCTLRASVNNLLNRHYAGMVVVNAPSFGGNPARYYYPGQPVNFRVGLDVGF